MYIYILQVFFGCVCLKLGCKVLLEKEHHTHTHPKDHMAYAIPPHKSGIFFVNHDHLPTTSQRLWRWINIFDPGVVNP